MTSLINRFRGKGDSTVTEHQHGDAQHNLQPTGNGSDSDHNKEPQVFDTSAGTNGTFLLLVLCSLSLA